MNSTLVQLASGTASGAGVVEIIGNTIHPQSTSGSIVIAFLSSLIVQVILKLKEKRDARKKAKKEQKETGSQNPV